MLRSPRRPATAVTVLLALVATADLLGLCADINSYLVLDDLLSAGDSDLKHADVFCSVAGLL
ncbi:hypothetical protein ACFY2W_24840 [Streptomyces sp. NPDC001262]|uniref:hypothetical protein n=1 Tax=Streptomyces sp. NPDC001262 TaxID=3364552 RepID=UPI003674E6A6